MHAHDQALLVVGAVEDGDLAALRQRAEAPPEKAMRAVHARGLLEAAHVDARGVDAAEDVADRRVFAGRVHGLQDHDDALACLGVQTVLQRLDARLVVHEAPFVLGPARGVHLERGGEALELEVLFARHREVAEILGHDASRPVFYLVPVLAAV